MQITLNRQASARAGNIARGRCVNWRNKFHRVPAAWYSLADFIPEIVHNAPPRNQQCCPLRKSHYAYATLSRSARCASQFCRDGQTNAPFVAVKTAYRIRELQSLIYLCRSCARWRNNFAEVYVGSTGFVHSQWICIQRFLLMQINWLKNN